MHPNPWGCRGCPGGYANFDTPDRRSDTLIKGTAPGKDLRYALRTVTVTIGLECLWYRSTGRCARSGHSQYCRTHEATGRPIEISRRPAQNVPGNQIPTPLVLAEPMETNKFCMEGHESRVIEVGYTDTKSTVLYVPSIDFVVAGDVVYGDVHQFFGEANTLEKRKEWLRALGTIEALKPHSVVAGHKRTGTVDGLFNVRSTREYILAFEEAVNTSSNWEDLIEQMKKRYPRRVNPHAIIRGAMAALPGGPTL